jgi:hypothetical protein
MKLTLLLGGAVGYVLGTRAGRERYEEIVSAARRVAGSQTIQATAGVLQAQIDTVASRAKDLISARMGGAPADSGVGRANGYRP